ncbi:hypothetical protein AU15_06395 [Marinobacter salarius]|uniref:N-acetyltransferase domain-containing protein n=1 Tax=Marinobacter salarius TaxID=1420917 RepID=W5YW44_9GAMM|nr:hypothetical protein AU15_06395 [Marinobacter salarius]
MSYPEFFHYDITRFSSRHKHDLDALVKLENRCFTEDRISRRSFRRFLDMPRDRLIVALAGDELVGYCLVLMSAATRLARIYSIAVSPAERGRNIGEQLVREAEAAAVDAGRIVMRLEVREDNSPAIRLYQRLAIASSAPIGTTTKTTAPRCASSVASCSTNLRGNFRRYPITPRPQNSPAARQPDHGHGGPG